MKLPELLKLAIEEQNWTKVCTVYTAITGEKIAPPKPKPKKVSLLELDIPEDLMASIEATRNDEDDEEEDEFDNLPEYYPMVEEDEQDEAVESLLVEVPNDPEPEEFEDSKKKEGDSEFSISHGVQGQKASSDGNGTIMKKVPIAGNKTSRPNRFKDNLSVDSGDLKKNNPILKKVYNKVGSRASRADLIDAPDTSKLYAVSCSLCNGKAKVTAAMARGYHKDEEQNTYRCTACDTPSGRARLARRSRDLGVYDG